MNAPHLKHVEYCYLWSKCCVQLRLKSDGEELIVAKLILLDSSRALTAWMPGLVTAKHNVLWDLQTSSISRGQDVAVDGVVLA